MVLGMEWLASLGEMRYSFHELTLQISVVGGYQTLKGDSDLTRVAASFKFVLKALHDQGQGFVVQYCSLQAESREPINCLMWT